MRGQAIFSWIVVVGGFPVAGPASDSAWAVAGRTAARGPADAVLGRLRVPGRSDR